MRCGRSVCDFECVYFFSFFLNSRRFLVFTSYLFSIFSLARFVNERQWSRAHAGPYDRTFIYLIFSRILSLNWNLLFSVFFFGFTDRTVLREAIVCSWQDDRTRLHKLSDLIFIDSNKNKSNGTNYEYISLECVWCLVDLKRHELSWFTKLVPGCYLHRKNWHTVRFE